MSSIMLYSEVPLFDAYPKLSKNISHIKLGHYPSPLIKASNLSKILDVKDLYIKDDGYSRDLNMPTGNKMRKLEYLLADAKNKGHKTVCTVGSAGSNHALETAACAKKVGLKSVLVLDDQKHTSVVLRNLKLMLYFGAEIIYAAPEYSQSNESLEQYAKEICNKNGYYFIPMGGSNALGSVGYVNAVFELKEQLKEKNISDPDIIYVTLGSAGTASGIIVGAKAVGLKSKIIPVRISFTPEYKSNVLMNLVNETGEFLKQKDESFPFESAVLVGTQITLPGLDVEINHDFVGAGYAAVTEESSKAILLLYVTNDIKLEHTYSGKTLSALADDAGKGKLKDKVVLFWNTFSYGSFKDFTSQVSDEDAYKNLPPELTHYITDSLQIGDHGV